MSVGDVCMVRVEDEIGLMRITEKFSGTCSAYLDVVAVPVHGTLYGCAVGEEMLVEGRIVEGVCHVSV